MSTTNQCKAEVLSGQMKRNEAVRDQAETKTERSEDSSKQRKGIVNTLADSRWEKTCIRPIAHIVEVFQAQTETLQVVYAKHRLADAFHNLAAEPHRRSR